MQIRTRFAPSPTGDLHIGGVRTALFSWLYARHHGGQFLLRIEDTDRERSTKAAVDVIIEGMKWLGMDYDEGPIFQTARLPRYLQQAGRLLDTGAAYHCYCSRDELDAMRADQLARGEKPRYDGRCRQRDRPVAGRQPVVRFRAPHDGVTRVDDLVHGPVEVENSTLDDLVLIRSDGTPTFHFGVVVDDGDMNISHVIRGDDHLNNTPRHLHLIDALGYQRPAFAHLPMILGRDGSKLSKRHGAVNILEYREQGYLPDAVLNYLVRLGWSHGDQEVFSREEMIALFELDAVNAAAARFDPEKLTWLNQQYLRQSAAEKVLPALRGQYAQLGIDESSGPPAERVLDAMRERATTLRDLAGSAAYLYRERLDRDASANARHLTAAIAPALRSLLLRLSALEQWQKEHLHAAMAEVAVEAGVGFGKLGQPVRVAVTGGTVSPPIDLTLELVGRERVLRRLQEAFAIASGNGAIP
jgi:glutamyl-tRNA synthetase